MTKKMQLFWIIYLFLISSTCFGRCLPIIMSTWLYLQLLILSTDISAGRTRKYSQVLLMMGEDNHETCRPD